VLAALIAAIVSSSAAIVNSSATIFSIDIYKFHVNPQISEENLVKVGRITSVLIVVLAAAISSFLTGIPQVFQFIQEYTGLVSPGISALFVLGLFWKKTTARAAWIAVLLTLPVPLILKWVYPDLPFLDNMVISFVIISLQMIVVSLWDNHKKLNASEWELPDGVFRMKDRKFIFFSIILMIILCLMYVIFW
jgi:SSS family solute:Na+ symporter